MRHCVAIVLVVALTACAPSEPVFSPAEKGILSSLSLMALGSPPDDPSNRVADDPRAVALGRDLFFDTRLSGGGDQSCASCHKPELFFTDGRVTGQGVATLKRNTPTLIGAGWQTWFYWDGRRDSLWSQAIVPIEAPGEMAGSRLGVARLIARDADYRARYEALFGALPVGVDAGDLPEHAGQFAFDDAKEAWLGLSPALQLKVNTVFANAGKAIAAYERTLAPAPSPFDDFLLAVTDNPAQTEASLSDDALAGARLFADVERSRCLQCHSGPMLTNGDFHNVGTGGMAGPTLDFGRMFGAQAVRLDPFNCFGPFSDASRDDCKALRFLAPDQHGETAGAFKVPTLRNVAETAPYFHDGRFATLRDVIAHYNNPPSPKEFGDHELTPLGLTEREMDQLVAFLESLTSSGDGRAPRTAQAAGASR